MASLMATREWAGINLNRNNDFANYMSTQGIGKPDDEDVMAFFFVNVTKEYMQMVKEEGLAILIKITLIAVCCT